VNYLSHLLILFAVYAIMALSLNIILGFCGVFSLAHSAFFAIGAYVYALLSLRFRLDFILAAGAGVAVAALLSLLISLPSWRLGGDYLLMVTLAAQSLIFSLLYNRYQLDAPVGSWRNLTNGPYGVMHVPGPVLAIWRFESTPAIAGVAVGTLIVVALVIRALLSSPWGRLLEAVRDDELVARNLGKHSRVAKVQALAIGCGIAGAAGALYASYATYIDPSICSTDDSILILAMVLIGGLGSQWGPMIGAAVMVALPEGLRFLKLPQEMAANLRTLILGVLLILTVHLRPQGITGRLKVE
jgi:branched-chain amino acid transport system permease protein